MSNFVINKGQGNNVVVTVSERSRLTDPFFLFVFNSKFAGNTEVCSLKASASNVRYNLFQITETTAPDNTAGEVELFKGEWTYNIYESVTQTTDPTSTTGRILQKGFIIVE